MSKGKKTTFRFSPRPEAHAMNWADLMPPVQSAVRDLLIRIEGATQIEAKDYEIAANCFLVHGDRGTGKTTVLLSAKDACNPKKKFFGEEKEKKEFAKEEVCADAIRSAENLKNVIWLDVLDLEPLPPRANLLTTVLTRVRNALYLSGSEKSFDETTSILEERADSARHKLTQLINDATLMWEDIKEPDTRSRANRQVAAADIYAQFQDRFKKAMNTLSLELGRRSGKEDKYSAIVLPIDNIDRSTEHLYSIVKLAQMVFCPCFWLVMAGGRQDVETFLERAYWKELIRIGEEGAGATGKTGVSGEDEALVMARRQAAAASHKLLPPSHRVEVELVEPKDTLKFKPSGLSNFPEANKNIRELLSDVSLTSEIVVETSKEQAKEKTEIKVQTSEEVAQENKEIEQYKITLIDLFDARNFVVDVVTDNSKEEDKSYLTEAAELGLRLPARGVIDLWQLAYWVTTDALIPVKRRAEKIARTMLRNTIAESNMSSETGRRLQEQIIRRNPQGGTMLDFIDPNSRNSLLEVLRLTALDFQIQLHQSRRISIESEENETSSESEENESLSYEAVARPRINVNQAKAMHLRLRHSWQKGSDQKDGDQSSDDMLPDLVAAWIIVLYDVLTWGAEDSAVIVSPDIEPSTNVQVYPEVVVVTNNRHVRLEQLTEWQQRQLTPPQWPMPNWGSFIENNVCGRLWDHFLDCIRENNNKLLDQADQVDALPRLLATGWIACALETFSAFQSPVEWGGIRGVLKRIKTTILAGADYEPGGMAQAIKDAETDVMKTAAEMYEKIIRAKNTKQRGVFLAEEGTISIEYWLEMQLPLLLSDLFVPMTHKEGDAETRAREINSLLKETNLAKSWESSQHFILADLEYLLTMLFPGFNLTNNESYFDIHQLWKQSDNKKTDR